MMNRAEELRVLIGASRLPSGDGRPTLIVEAEAEHVEELRLRLSRSLSGGPFEVVHTVIVGESEAELAWFYYNDTRMNGPVELERWQRLYPNTVLDRQEARSGQTLAKILKAWPSAQDERLAIELTISQGDPIQALIGAGDWLLRIQHVQLQGPGAEALWGEACDDWLQKHGFRPDSQASLSWNMDPLASQLIRLKADHKAQSSLQQQEAQQRAMREKLILAALSHVFPYSVYRNKRPDLSDLKDDGLMRHFVNNGINEDVDLRFGILEAEIQQLKGKYVDQLLQESESLRIAHNLAVEQVNQLDAQVQILRTENEDLRRREQLLARLTEDSEQQLAMIRDLFVQLSAARAITE
jgi:hypothetical protein